MVELAAGSGNYRFDCLVHAVPKGFEDYEVYLYKDPVTGSSSEALPPASADIVTGDVGDVPGEKIPVSRSWLFGPLRRGKFRGGAGGGIRTPTRINPTAP